MTDELLKWRSEFPIVDKTVYLISHRLGAMPKSTYDRLHDYAETWATGGVRAWAELVGDAIDRRRRSWADHQRRTRLHGNAPECFHLPVTNPFLFRAHTRKQDRIFRT